MYSLQSTSQFTNYGVKCLIYGGSGTGKTRLAASCPYPIILSAEAGLLSLRQSNLPFLQVSTLQDLQTFYNWAAGQNIQGLPSCAQNFRTLFLDSISEIAEVVLRNELSKTKDPRKAYGELIIQVITLAKNFRDLPGYNVVMTAKEEYSKDENTGMFNFAPNLPGSKLGPSLPYYFDEVFRTVTGTDPATRQRWEALRTRSDGQSVAKDRSGALNEWEPQNLGVIFQKIAG